MTRWTAWVALSLGMLLQACAMAPGDPSAAGGPETVPELTLNLPEENCVCVESEQVDYTFLEKGFKAVIARDYIEAVQHLQRYSRMEDSPAAQWESGIAIAYISMLPHSPFFDPEEARKSFKRLDGELSKGLNVHPETLLMRESLETFVVMDRHIDDVERNNAMLKEDLEKREDALKRLRELTLGQ